MEGIVLREVAQREVAHKSSPVKNLREVAQGSSPGKVVHEDVARGIAWGMVARGFSWVQQE